MKVGALFRSEYNASPSLSGEHMRPACWFRLPAETNFESHPSLGHVSFLPRGKIVLPGRRRRTMCGVARPAPRQLRPENPALHFPMKKLLTFILASLCVLCGRSSSAEKPNIIFILSDDLAHIATLACRNFATFPVSGSSSVSIGPRNSRMSGSGRMKNL